MLSHYYQQLINWIFPNTCVFCAQITHSAVPNACEACMVDLPWIQHACQRCGVPMLPQSPTQCGACNTSPPPYTHLHALFYYQFPVDQLILRLKFHEQLIYAKLLGHLLAHRAATYYTTMGTKPAMLIPMPLHAKRLRQRGFNQATELARPISQTLGLPLHMGSIIRKKYTRPQMELPLTQRSHNVRQAFHHTNTLPAHVAIIDDVVTSGHTIDALSQTLQKAGAKTIDVWCVARTHRS